eukprot:TRINITY_DN30754_c0_g1_i1.p1 TRINITY_DN30754_c0_g1~~TRINITY_DN30754_c0_g1_i1.p1  ORF type:complete len:169 (-),score=47.41 TRINITY_DN30754_c0_g1_i1:33-515(-)
MGIVLVAVLVCGCAAIPNSGEHGDHAIDHGEQHLAPHDVNVSGHVKNNNGDHGDGGHSDGGHHGGIHLVSWRWSEFSSAIMFSGMIISAVILKIIFHHMPWLAKALPESCVLIVVGILSGTFIHYVVLDDILHLEDKSEHPFPHVHCHLVSTILLPPNHP